MKYLETNKNEPSLHDEGLDHIVLLVRGLFVEFLKNDIIQLGECHNG